MSGNFIKLWALAALLAGLCAPALANTTDADTPRPLRLAQTDLALPPAGYIEVEPMAVQAPELSTQPLGAEGPASVAPLAAPSGVEAIAPSVVVPFSPAPVVPAPVAAAPGAPGVRVALLLPLRSEALAAAAEAVRGGFIAAHELDPSGIVVTVLETGDAVQDVLSGYTDAAARHDIVVGPLTRSGATAIAQRGGIRVPTIALTQLDGGVDNDVAAAPPGMLVMGLSIEDEARQVAELARADRALRLVFAISTNVSWQRRAVRAFSGQWQRQGLPVQSMELGISGGYLNANALLQLRKRIQAEQPTMLFVALDAAQARQLRSAIGNDVPLYGTSQLNPLTLADWSGAEPLQELEGARLLDMPWQLQADHPAVMAYTRAPPAAQSPAQVQGRRGADLERLYALGIDAYRVAREIARKQDNFNLDGVTGKLSVRLSGGVSRFERVEQPAIYQNGVVQAVQAP